MEPSSGLQHQPLADADVPHDKDSWTNNSPNGNSTLGLWGDAIYPALNSNWAQPSKQIIARLTSTIGTSMVNDFEFAYSDNRINITPGGTNPGSVGSDYGRNSTSYPRALKTSPVGTPTLWGGLGNYTSGNTLWLIAPWYNSLDIYTVRDDFSKVVGAQTLRFGGVPGLERQERNATVPTSPASIRQFSNRTGIPPFRPATTWRTSGPRRGLEQPGRAVDQHRMSTCAGAITSSTPPTTGRCVAT